jgi:hypothetical protein
MDSLVDAVSWGLLPEAVPALPHGQQQEGVRAVKDWLQMADFPAQLLHAQVSCVHCGGASDQALPRLADPVMRLYVILVIEPCTCCCCSGALKMSSLQSKTTTPFTVFRTLHVLLNVALRLI